MLLINSNPCAGGLYDCVHDIVHLSSEQNVPIFYGLNKTKISKILARPKSTITSAVSVFSYHGAEVNLTFNLLSYLTRAIVKV